MDKQFTNRREDLDKELESAGCKPGNLKLIVLTHGDIYHCANAAYLREKHNTKIAIHHYDAELVEKISMESIMSNFKFNSLIFKIIFFLMGKKIKKIFVKTIDDFEVFKPDILIDESYSLTEYGLDAKIIHTPGHTAGSVAIFTSEGDLISGDTFTYTNKAGISPNAWDFNKLKDSVERLKTMNIKNVYPGHGKPFEASQL